ncbi:hypothetical protein [Agilicoccus flavus]|uniref:hypothetical protein n=1 Tax=Agilicoccus flavus TaxID=2775968 RepID=UPI001CF65FEC|nr:hypothetical protein [Agilicoccus flavus]
MLAASSAARAAPDETGVTMRWNRLFDDLEGRSAQERRREVEAEVAERIRADRARITLADRLAAHEGDVGLVLWTGRLVAGVPEEVGAGWVLLRSGRARLLVPLGVVVEAEGLGRSAAPPDQAVRRLGLAGPLRSMARDRAVVDVEDRLGRRITGTIDAVGADAFELAEHPAHLPRRASNVVAERVLGFAGLLVVGADR